ncbi:hypothetical protein [Stutzerimonas zhaodongensis]|uniref:hypothetical protein n=1 Tax=Stutzerimonas TaxID=2901164 RepID=UPI00388FEC46
MRGKNSLPRYMRPGGFYDLSSVKGNIRYILLCLLGACIIWYSNHIFDGLDMLFEFSSTPDSESTIRVRRFWAGVLGAVGTLTGLAKILWLYRYRKHAIKSAEGQWYDNPSLSKKDLTTEERGDVS